MWVWFQQQTLKVMDNHWLQTPIRPSKQHMSFRMTTKWSRSTQRKNRKKINRMGREMKVAGWKRVSQAKSTSCITRRTESKRCHPNLAKNQTRLSTYQTQIRCFQKRKTRRYPSAACTFRRICFQKDRNSCPTKTKTTPPKKKAIKLSKLICWKSLQWMTLAFWFSKKQTLARSNWSTFNLRRTISSRMSRQTKLTRIPPTTPGLWIYH